MQGFLIVKKKSVVESESDFSDEDVFFKPKRRRSSKRLSKIIRQESDVDDADFEYMPKGLIPEPTITLQIPEVPDKHSI